MAKKFVPLPTHPGKMDGDSLRAALDGLPDSQVMRSLLLAEVDAIRNGAERETRTMRHLWYNLIKPALSRAGLLYKTTTAGKPVKWDRNLSAYLAELVREGVTTYEELSIVDSSRQRQPATAITQPVASVQLVGAHYPWLILFTEKDTIWGELQALASLYGVSAISGKGQPSNACTENTVKAILGSDAYQDGQPLVVLSLTDYDPAGYSIANAQFVQVQETARGCEVFHERLGLTPGQLTGAEVAENAYEPADKGLAAWLEETGGINGQPLGLELDALELSRLRAMFAEGIERYIDLGARREDLRFAFVDLLAWELLEPYLEAKRAAIWAEIQNNGLWRRIVETPLPDALFLAAARSGWDRIDPTITEYKGDLLFDCADELQAAMRHVLKADRGLIANPPPNGGNGCPTVAQG